MSDLMLMGAGSSASAAAPAATERTVVGFGSSVSTATDSTSFYFPVGGIGSALNTTQANGAHPWRGPGTFRKFQVHVSANARTTDTIVVWQKNGADQALTVTIPGSSGATTVTDDTHSFDVVDGDVIGIRVITSTGGGTITIRWGTAQFETTGQIFTHKAFYGGSANTASTFYYAAGGNGVQSGTEATVDVVKALEQYTASNMFSLISVNGAATTATFTSQDAGADGNQTYGVLATVTGLAEDTTNSDTIAVDQTFTIRKGSTTLNITVIGAGIKAVWGTAKKVQLDAVGATNATAGTTSYGGPFGTALVGTTESFSAQRIPFAARFSKLGCFIGSNASTVESTLTLRIAGADTSVTVPIPAGATGFRTISGNTADCAANDLVGWKITGQDGTVRVDSVSLMCEDIT